MAVQTDRGVPLSTLCPKFLHTNSTSHTWPFSAIAELVDNAYDPDVSAKQFWIDKTVVKGQDCLTFMDNGNGLDHATMHKMLSFGYSDKIPMKGITPIGMYGNGFKSGSMRLGEDAIVFSKSKSVSCVGMLSQTYLKEIGANQIIVPIICFKQTDANKIDVPKEQEASLQDILRYSPYNTQEELLMEIGAVGSHLSKGKTGTRIIIWNLRRTSTGTSEFDFEKDRYDIRIPSDVYETMNNTSSQHQDRTASYTPECCYSLRAYCSILYLKPRMQIIIRGQKVKSQLVAKTLALVRKDHYKPNFLEKRIPITFGYNTKRKEQYGIMMYHKNRLIKAYERVGCQLKANNKGVGVIGVVECYFLEPTHNKQSFNETDKYRKTLSNLATKLEEYWNEIRYMKKQEDPNSTTPVEDTTKRPDQNWVQCDDCLNWRKLPDGIDCDKLPEKWFCRMNPNPQFRSCQAEQEASDSDDDQPSYRKTYKQQEREDKRNQEREKQKAEEELKRLASLAKQKQTQALLQLKKTYIPTTPKSLATTPNSLATTPKSLPTTPKSRFNTVPTQGGAARAQSSALRSSILSQAACSPSSISGLPVISGVCSLSPGAMSDGSLRRKRAQSAEQAVKRLKMNGIHKGNSHTSTSVDNDDTEDDVCILEDTSTPKPITPGFDWAKVKTEPAQSDAINDMLYEYFNDNAMDDGSDTNDAVLSSAAAASGGTSTSRAPCPKVASSTTQTEVLRVKKEEEDHAQTEGEGREGQSTACMNDAVQSSDVAVWSIKQESRGVDDAGRSCENQKEDSLLHNRNMSEVQKQQDQLLLATVKERDSLKEQFHRLTCQLQEMQSRLQELSEINVKKECSHQACQTEETERQQDYKELFERANEKVDQLMKEKEVLLAAAEVKPSISEVAEEQYKKFAIEVELDQTKKEKSELRSQLNSLEQEKANLETQCEELRLSLQQHRENIQERSTSTAQAAATAGPSTDSSSDTSISLIELRHNVGRLLVSFVPYLDLEQVNYECNVIDEILEQYLSSGDSPSLLS